MLPCSLQRQRLGGDWTRADIEEVAWRPSGDGRFGWFGSQNHRAGKFPVWVFKLRARPVRLDGEDGHGGIAKLR